MQESNRANLVRSTLLVMVSFGLAKVISLAQTFIIAQTFGSAPSTMLLLLPTGCPEVIFNLIAGGAIAFAFIPVFTGLLAQDETRTAWKTASHIVNTMFLLTLVVSIIAFVFAPWLVTTQIAPGFPPDIQAKTAELMRILLISTLIFSVSGLVMGILQSHNRFLLPALAPILFDLGILGGVIVLLPILESRFGSRRSSRRRAASWRANSRSFPGEGEMVSRVGLNDPNFRRIIR
jgi:putative peptidoglycan lipid II flippase